MKSGLIQFKAQAVLLQICAQQSGGAAGDKLRGFALVFLCFHPAEHVGIAFEHLAHLAAEAVLIHFSIGF